MQVIRWICVAMVAATVAALAANTGTDPAHKYAWGENVGWANAGPSSKDEVTVHFDESTGWLSGCAWGENVGWIVMGSPGGGPYGNTSSNNWGVNLAASGNLSGYAWGENIGWVTFEQTDGHPAISLVKGVFSGRAWGENVGWLTFQDTSPDYMVRTFAFDRQPQGTPNWWLDFHHVTEDYDAGDGMAAWRKYVMDTDPHVAGDYLRITAVSNAPAGTDVAVTPASTRRYYTLTRREDLAAGTWNSVIGQVAMPGIGGNQTMRDTNTAARAFYSVKVTVAP